MNPNRPIIKAFILIILFFSAPNSMFALNTDQDEILHIKSGPAIYDREHHMVTYEGNVQVDQGTSHLDGDKVIVYQTEDDKIKQLVAYGNPAHYSTIPGLNQNRLYVEALQITYDPNQKTVLLEGKGRVNQDGNVFSGPHIWYDMANGIVRSQPVPGSHERTEVTFQPKNNKTKH